MFIGYHTSIKSKELHKSIKSAYIYSNANANAFQIFLKTPRRKIMASMDDTDAKKCKKFIKDNKLFLVIHSSYLLNIASLSELKYKEETALDDLVNAEKIGAVGAIFHVGKYLKMDKSEALKNMEDFIRRILHKIKDTKSLFILETAAGCGTELCSNINDLSDFYDRFSIKEKRKVKICIDTCHIFSAGYDISTKKAAIKFIKLIDNTIKWGNVAVIHLNDSKKELNCHVDRHENLGDGFIGKDSDKGFRTFIQFCTSVNIPIILETPINGDSRLAELDMIKGWCAE